jgi:hypothetical protein
MKQGIGILLSGLFGTGTGSTVSVYVAQKKFTIMFLPALILAYYWE